MTDVPAPLWGGGQLRLWLLEGGRPERPSPLTSRWRAAAFDAANVIQGALPPAPALARPPLFILGLWRTGTTLLHQTLDSLPGFHAPQTWQCFRPSSFRLLGPPRGSTVVPRPMDGAPVGPTTAQEDEFALLLQGNPSLYRGFLDPRRLPELRPLLHGGDGNAWEARLKTFLAGVQPATDGVRMAVKSPNHLFRIRSLQASFSDSPLIVTVRDAADTYWSNVRMWKAMCELYGLWAIPEGVIEAFVADAIAAAAVLLAELQGARRLPIAAIDFEALVADPAGATVTALRTFGLTCPERALDAIRQAGPGRPPRTVRRAVPEFAEDACRHLAAVQARLRADP